MNPAPSYWAESAPWRAFADRASDRDVTAALAHSESGPKELAALLSPAAGRRLEDLARKALALTRRHFGRTLSLYVPLYLSNHCSGGCAYCGFAADRQQPRMRLDSARMEAEMEALRAMGFDDILLLTGENAPEADFAYLRDSVALAARRCHRVAIETFAMTREQYADIFAAGCAGVTLYQETYDPDTYRHMHRWGAKTDFAGRLDAPARALAAEARSFGLGALLGLADPVGEMLSLFLHLTALRKMFWKAEYSVSFPRLRRQAGEFRAPHPVDDRRLAQLIFAMRICLPTVPLVLSTRESAAFRDGIAGIGITRMSVASRTTVGGYRRCEPDTDGQFSVCDTRDPVAFCDALRRQGLQPVFKNWDAALR